MSKASKNILICVSGLTPQIVTETLFCLAVKEKIPVHEVYVLTTVRGRDVILGIDEAKTTPKSPLKKEIKNLCTQYKISIPAFENNDKHIIVAKEESIELPDIRSDKHNIMFPNKVSAFIKEKTLDENNVLYCSITGGRKSMSVHLANAVSLFGRESDKLLHVLTKAENEFKGFYPVNKKEINELELSEIPFVRLRSLLSVELKSGMLLNLTFDKIVAYTQTQLKILGNKNKLRLDIEKRELSYGYEKLQLEPMEFLFYYFFVDNKMQDRNKININEIISTDTSNKFISYIEQYYPHYYVRENQKNNWLKHGFDAKDFRTKRTKINQKIRSFIPDSDIAFQYCIEVDKIYSDSKYFIPAVKEQLQIILPR